MNVRILCALLAACSALAVAVPVAIPNAGLTVELPSNWSLDSSAASNGRPSYYLLPNDTSLKVSMGIDLYDSLDLAADTSWAYDQSYAYKIYVDYMACPSQVLSWASSVQNGLQSYYLNSTQASDSVCSEYRGWHNRYFAYASHGWEVYLTGDTTEIANHYDHYSAMMDSITIDRNWNGWTPVAIGNRPRSGKSGSTLRTLRTSESLQILAAPGTRGTLVDLRGRTLASFVLDAHGQTQIATGGLKGLFVIRTETDAGAIGSSATVTLMP